MVNAVKIQMINPPYDKKVVHATEPQWGGYPNLKEKEGRSARYPYYGEYFSLFCSKIFSFPPLIQPEI